MKVAHLHASDIYGGVETFLSTLARERGQCPEMEPYFGLCFEQRLTDEVRTSGTPVTMLGEARFSRPASVLKSRRAFAQMLREVRPDVVVCHVAKTYWLFAGVARKMGIPTVYYMHVPIHTMALFDKMIRKGPAPDLMIGVSDHTVQQGKERMFPTAPTATINYPMPWPLSRFAFDEASRASLRQEMDTAPDAVVIIQATRMDPWKGHKDMFAGLGRMKEVPGWVHWLVGGTQKPAEQEYQNQLKQIANDLGIADRIRFLGQRSDVPRLLAASDVYCQANVESEGFSLSFTEACSAALPVVTTDIGSAKEVVQSEVTGLLTPLHDAPALADALTTVVTDHERRRAMGQAARSRIIGLCETGQQIRRLHTELGRVAKTKS